MKLMNFRNLHRKISLWLVPFLLVSAATGVTYRIGRAWFGMSSKSGGDVLSIHTWDWLGNVPSLAILWVVGSGLLFLCFSGLQMLWQSRKRLFHSPQKFRVFHRLAGAMFVLPLMATAVTGIAYKTGEACDFSDETLDFLMVIHEGAWLGNALKPYYVLLLGGGMLWLVISGLKIVLRKKNDRTMSQSRGDMIANARGMGSKNTGAVNGEKL